MVLDDIDLANKQLLWENFVATGRLTNTLKKEIADSWKRCYKMKVDPYDGFGHLPLTKIEFANLLAKKKVLLDVARPLMEKLYRFVAGSGFLVMLSDEDGFIMDVLGDKDSFWEAEKLGFAKGVNWSEEQVGTNAIGTAIKLGRPIQVSGAEHYCIKHHKWTCSAAPIFDSDGKMTGILNISGPCQESHLHTLGMAVSAAEAITVQMRIQHKNHELNIINSRMQNVFENMSDGVIILDKYGVIRQINPAAEKILERSAAKVEKLSISEVIPVTAKTLEMVNLGKDYDDVEVTIQTEHGAVCCVVSGKPIYDERGQVSGGVIIINPIKKIKNLVNRYSGAHATFHFQDIIGQDRRFLQAIQIALAAADKSSNVLLQGESGTGKELFAQSIHNSSSRAHGPFVAVNCGAIPRELLSSELFGYVEGAFTGAKRGGRPGKFELASGGTLLLDEIGEMPLGKQVSLLRAIQEKEITRVGDNKVIPVDVRIICATNKNLQKEVEKGNFRQDLYYRLNVISITLPPLRERTEDIALLFNHFLKDICQKLEIIPPEVDITVWKYLMQYDWPGNVRELQNVVERIINVTNGKKITPEYLPAELLNKNSICLPKQSYISTQEFTFSVGEEREKKKRAYYDLEKQEIINLLGQYGGNISRIAKEMGISRNTLYRKLKKYDITL